MDKECTSDAREDEIDYSPQRWTRRDEIVESFHVLVSHHPPSLFSHCVRISVRGRSLYLCGRCTGMYGGLGFGIVVILAFNVSMEPTWLWFLLALALGFATVTDWMTQRLTPRKTTVRVRFSTGFASGVGLAIVFLLRDMSVMLVTLAIMAVSVGVVSLIENRRTRTAQQDDPRLTEV
ncbi:MAG: DUF2085 domain-containing protein [Candidatus Thorarchaeota archaeon]|nr:DUF2085 domain-containing protein [Candidatus Thorarchaeota archaeon]